MASNPMLGTGQEEASTPARTRRIYKAKSENDAQLLQKLRALKQQSAATTAIGKAKVHNRTDRTRKKEFAQGKSSAPEVEMAP